VSLIVDGHHLAPETVRLATAAASGRFALITDANAGAGQPEGTYTLGDQMVQVAGTEARLEDGTLAGSVLTMDRAVRNLIDLGIGPESAIEAATQVPAAAAGQPRLGRLEPGTPADIAVIDQHFEVVATLIDGDEVYAL